MRLHQIFALSTVLYSVSIEAFAVVHRKRRSVPLTAQPSGKQFLTRRKRRRVQFVPWAKNGMLPHQYYSGVLDHTEYQDWLQTPLNSNVNISASGAQDYFSSLSATENMQVQLPHVQPMHLKPIYIDDHIIVVDKPSGVLSVPGPRRHECVASLAYRFFGKSEANSSSSRHQPISQADRYLRALTDEDNKQIDTMVVHRLDRDTSGVLMFARNDAALKELHDDFKDKSRQRVTKKYVALVCGHWHGDTAHKNGIATHEGEIDLPLMRDPNHPPFMCIATAIARSKKDDLKQQLSLRGHEQSMQNPGYIRMISKGAKPSLTTYRILSYEYLTDAEQQQLPVTRVELVPITGRTHQLRVHCAAVGHPIVGDSIYGFNGEGASWGGLEYKSIDDESLDVQRNIRRYWIDRHQYKWNSKESSCGAKMSKETSEECFLCLHAYQLAISHPMTKAPMMFECIPPF